MKIIFLFLISAVVGILLSAQSSSAASIRLRRTNSVGVESSDHDDKAPSYAAMNRNSIRSLQGLDKSMSMSMSMMTAGIESATESGSDDWVLEVINKLESETGVAITQSVAMNIIKSNELPAHHHHSGQMKCRWFLTLLFKFKHYYFFGLSDDYLNHIFDYVCSEDETTSTSTVAASTTTTTKDETTSTSTVAASTTTTTTSTTTTTTMSTCPDGSSTDEGEGCRTSQPDTFNGGCSSGGSGFTNITFGESVCGTVGRQFGIVADSDWYYFEVSTETTVSVRLTTDFSAVLFWFRLGDVDPCGGFSLVAEGTDVGNNTYVISENVTAGDYSILVASGGYPM